MVQKHFHCQPGGLRRGGFAFCLKHLENPTKCDGILDSMEGCVLRGNSIEEKYRLISVTDIYANIYNKILANTLKHKLFKIRCWND